MNTWQRPFRPLPEHRGAGNISIRRFSASQAAAAEKGFPAEGDARHASAWVRRRTGTELSCRIPVWCAVLYAMYHYIAFCAGFQAGFFIAFG